MAATSVATPPQQQQSQRQQQQRPTLLQQTSKSGLQVSVLCHTYFYCYSHSLKGIDSHAICNIGKRSTVRPCLHSIAQQKPFFGKATTIPAFQPLHEVKGREQLAEACRKVLRPILNPAFYTFVAWSERHVRGLSDFEHFVGLPMRHVFRARRPVTRRKRLSRDERVAQYTNRRQAGPLFARQL